MTGTGGASDGGADGTSGGAGGLSGGGAGGEGGVGGSSTINCPNTEPTGRCLAFTVGDTCDYRNGATCVCTTQAGGRAWQCSSGNGGAGGTDCPARRPGNLAVCSGTNSAGDVCPYAAGDCTCTAAATGQPRWVCL